MARISERPGLLMLAVAEGMAHRSRGLGKGMSLPAHVMLAAVVVAGTRPVGAALGLGLGLHGQGVVADTALGAAIIAVVGGRVGIGAVARIGAAAHAVAALVGELLLDLLVARALHVLAAGLGLDLMVAHLRFPFREAPASLSAIAIACFLDETFGPVLLPLCKVPALNFDIS